MLSNTHIGWQEFLSAFGKVKDALDSVYNDVVSIDSEVRAMSSHLQATRAQTYQLIDHTTQLQAQRYALITIVRLLENPFLSS